MGGGKCAHGGHGSAMDIGFGSFGYRQKSKYRIHFFAVEIEIWTLASHRFRCQKKKQITVTLHRMMNCSLTAA